MSYLIKWSWLNEAHLTRGRGLAWSLRLTLHVEPLADNPTAMLQGHRAPWTHLHQIYTESSLGEVQVKVKRRALKVWSSDTAQAGWGWPAALGWDGGPITGAPPQGRHCSSIPWACTTLNTPMQCISLLIRVLLCSSPAQTASISHNTY